ncbi:MAG: leucyl/phenylalanyl-tRNA--protein transferase [Proteobacteria bacterium]|jgi:leucyl/phenylalanyl-tRNA--protein transferase|nr:leucyl/phenylalanyl-tRNA--protein transferase [Desulfocapsa sp.]MBU3944599.1 leucyl/phenylalanyl-tRNA--protein transferase [Pseudomonadota bacterium]MBU3982285.1 leucyl/phenylalanyl-tRNA--protein transferase [Pseudomonadota bacterium]MBU4027642.1 leucyl/phenylalanyl-tRNA--protein transferase [Pseudomonadota bacterium]MBU4043665.1 leucyl/phenylalanyl-tRNA--protein transferase [Pseudomonadota bacterium]
MSLFQLTDEIIFPQPSLADKNGLLAIGGDLHPDRLVAAYRSGIFPWFSPGDPLLWWFVDPRLVIFLTEFKISRRLARDIKQGRFRVTYDRAFARVIASCAQIRQEEGEGTWISGQMQNAYCRLHELGYAHSVECWQGDILAGGLYGIALDRIFFGESMFTRVSNGSKVALAALVSRLNKMNFHLIDCQMTTHHLLSFGAREISGTEFLDQLKLSIQTTVPGGKWCDDVF